jgi:hypothetical protein
VIGSFDIAFSNATFGMIAAVLLGAWSSSLFDRPMKVASSRGRGTGVVLALVGLLVVVSATTRLIGGVALARSNTTSRLERAATIAPGDYRIHVRLAQIFDSAGVCGRAQFHAQAAKKLYPYTPAIRALASGCSNRGEPH